MSIIINKGVLIINNYLVQESPSADQLSSEDANSTEARTNSAASASMSSAAKETETHKRKETSSTSESSTVNPRKKFKNYFNDSAAASSSSSSSSLSCSAQSSNEANRKLKKEKVKQSVCFVAEAAKKERQSYRFDLEETFDFVVGRDLRPIFAAALTELESDIMQKKGKVNWNLIAEQLKESVVNGVDPDDQDLIMFIYDNFSNAELNKAFQAYFNNLKNCL